LDFSGLLLRERRGEDAGERREGNGKEGKGGVEGLFLGDEDEKGRERGNGGRERGEEGTLYQQIMDAQHRYSRQKRNVQ